MLRAGLALLLALAGCGDDASSSDAGLPPGGDAGAPAPDAGRGDAAGLDAGALDAGIPRVCSIDVAPGGEVTDTCDGDTLCVCPGGDAECEDTGRCLLAFGRRYTIFLVGVELPDRRPDGECWDDGCGPPDPYVTFAVDGEAIGRSPAVPDDPDATWSPPLAFEAVIERDAEIAIDVLDDDGGDDDVALECVRRVSSGFFLRRRVLGCAGPPGLVRGAILPLGGL